MLTCNMHNLESVTADTNGPVSWLKLRADDGATVAIFMPRAAADAMVAAYEGAMQSSSVRPGWLIWREAAE